MCLIEALMQALYTLNSPPVVSFNQTLSLKKVSNVQPTTPNPKPTIKPGAGFGLLRLI